MTKCPKCGRVLSGHSWLDEDELVEYGMPCDGCAKGSGLYYFFSPKKEKKNAVLRQQKEV